MSVREFLLPDLGEGLEDAEVVAWKVAEGDRVELNQVLVEVNTAKALVEIPSPWEGVVRTLHAADGDVVEVGKPLVTIDVAEDITEEAVAPTEAKPKRRAVLVGYGVAEDEETHPEPVARKRAPRGAERVRATPVVRRLAKEMGIDLATVSGTGPNGRITRTDVEDASHRGSTPGAERRADLYAGIGPADDEGRRPFTLITGESPAIPVRGVRRLVAEKMARSVREIPHVTTFLTVDCTWLLAFREELSRQSGSRITPLPIIVRALVDVCRDHPMLNATWQDDGPTIEVFGHVHVGIAADTEQGLMVPVVHDAGSLGILELAGEMARLVEAARTGRARPNELFGSTITVSNVGTFGAEFGTPIINHPEAAILAVGVIEPRALVVDGDVVARSAATLSLSFDHRVMDGAEAGRALKTLGELLESPFRLGALPR